jgi:hypothetical protein
MVGSVGGTFGFGLRAKDHLVPVENLGARSSGPRHESFRDPHHIPMMKAMNTLRLTMIVAVLLGSVAACSKDPQATSLPLNLADIPKVQPQLDKLPADERQLVLDYLKRSNGDVLPANLTDPSAPLTARTFAEAIKLQKEFVVRHSAEEANVAEFRAERDTAIEPLREALSIEIVKKEIVTADEATGRRPSPGEAIPDAPTLVTTYRLRNNTAQTIVHVTASVSVRSPSDPDSLMGLDRCFIDRSEPIQGGQSLEVRCGNVAQRPGDQSKEYVAMSESSLLVRWEPKAITFEGGRVLTAAQ